MTFSYAKTYSIGRPREGTIRLWTIQPLEVWEKLLREKTLLADPSHPRCCCNGDAEFRKAYDWMYTQMAQKIPGYQGHYPWWAYDFKLDLRRLRYQTNPPDARHVRIALNVPPEDVLLMGYEAWFWVLNRWYLPASFPGEFMEADDAWEEEAKRNGVNPNAIGPLPQPWESEMIASWQNIFDLERWREDTVIQAVFEKLELRDVLEVTEFTSCVPAPNPYIESD